MKNILLTLALSTTTLSINTYANSDKFNDALAKVIRSSDYSCDYVNKSFRAKQTERGKEIDVQCNGGKFLYRVIITPSERFIVEIR